MEHRPLEIVIPIFPRFTALDAVGPYEILHRLPDARLRFVGEEAGGLYTADSGVLTLRADASWKDTPRPDILLMPGGFGIRALVQNQAFLAWIRQVHETTIYTTSVCTGSLVLAAAGLLNGLEATTHWNTYEYLEKLGAKPVSKRVVQEGKIITSAGVSSGIDMAIKLATLLKGEKIAKILQLFVEYDPQPPYDVGSKEKAGDELVALTIDYIAKFRKPGE